MKSNKGFTLVELIVVIVIIAVLVGVAILGATKWVNEARENQDINNCKALETAIIATTATAQLPALGFPYCWGCFSDENDGYENIYWLACVFGETVGKESYELDRYCWNFNNIINKSFQDRNTNKPRYKHLPFISQTGGSVFIIVCVDEDGNMVKTKVGIIDKNHRSRWSLWRLGMLYHPDVETTAEMESILTVVGYDGSYKFFD